MPRPVLVSSRILLALVFVAVTVLSLTPSPPSAPGGWDKIGHLVAYLALGFLLVLSVSERRFRLTLVIALVAATIAYGAMIEFVQRMTGRQFDVADMAMNALGAVTGTVLGIAARRIVERETGAAAPDAPPDQRPHS